MLLHLFINSGFFLFIKSNFDFHFKHPTTIQVSGPTLCGTTKMVLRILEEQLVQQIPTRIIWVFSEWQPDYVKARALYPHIAFVRGCPMSCIKCCGKMRKT